ncbi:hypothetical protein PVAP13_3NG239110 [Panicum virgatum]|uniref:Uncharacterized protein n=1 Tax=Panicum virgatum TaxID=38727 RepID=A0A8T0U329_PANVG|nr:hypothetical protein PVAP13_3NG239110 [Panicum virgatum]
MLVVEYKGFLTCHFLRVMKLDDFPKLKHLDGLAVLPCLEELEPWRMPSLESISGGPFRSLVKLVMVRLPCLGEVWMVVEKSMPDGEEGRGCSNCTPHLGQVLRVGAFVSNLDISLCPKLEVKPYLPLSLQHLELYRSNEKLLQLPCECSGSASSFFGFSHLKKLMLQGITRHVNFSELSEVSGTTNRGTRNGKRGTAFGMDFYHGRTKMFPVPVPRTAVTLELIQLPDCFQGLKSLQFLEVSDCSAIRMRHESLGELQSLQELTIRNCNSLTTLPQSMGHLTSLRSLILDSCSAISLLLESLGELHSLQELTVQSCRSLSSLPQSVVRLTSLQVLRISCCDAFHELPERLGELRSLRRFHIGGSRGLACLPESMCGLTSLEDLSIWECQASNLCRRG